MNADTELNEKIKELLEAFGNRKSPEYAGFMASLYSICTLVQGHPLARPVLEQMLDSLNGITSQETAMEVTADFNTLMKIQYEVFLKAQAEFKRKSQ